MIRAIGIGDNVVDKYVHTGIMYPGGNALNFAVFAAQLGCEAAYLGQFGTDAAGGHVRATLLGLGLDTSRCRVVPGENGYAKVTLVDGDRVFIPGNRGGVMRLSPMVLSEEDLAYIRGFDWAHSSCFSYIEDQLPRIAATGVPLGFDFSNRGTDEYLEKVCPSLRFAFLSAGQIEADGDAEAMLERCLHYGAKAALATRGVRAALFYDGKAIYRQSPVPVHVVDTMGAGDAFLTTFSIRYLEANGGDCMPFSDYPKEKARIEAALKAAAEFAAGACLVRGTFGFGVPYRD